MTSARASRETQGTREGIYWTRLIIPSGAFNITTNGDIMIIGFICSNPSNTSQNLSVLKYTFYILAALSSSISLVVRLSLVVVLSVCLTPL